MLSSKSTILWLAALALCTTAGLAQNVPPPPEGGPVPPSKPPSKDVSPSDMAKHHAQMCIGHYAQEVGALASLETELQLTDAQKPAFEKWKAVKLTAAKTQADICAARPPPPPPTKDGTKPNHPSPVEALKNHEQRLKVRLNELKAEQPALEALVDVLSPEQLRLLTPPHGGPHDGGQDKGPHDGMGPGNGPAGAFGGSGEPPPRD